MENRRKHPRIPLVTTARLSRQGAGERTIALVRDISVRGIGIYTKEPYQKGELLFVQISIVTDEKEVIDEILIGEVTWVAPVKDEANILQNAGGIVFEQLEVEKPKLYAYIKKLEAAFNHP